MKKYNYALTYLALSVLSAPLAFSSYAQNAALQNLETVGKGALFKTDTDLKMTIGSLIQILLGFVGIIFLILIIMGGFQWMTSGGNEQSVAAAKKRIASATIGLTLVLMSYAIARSITSWLSKAV